MLTIQTPCTAQSICRLRAGDRVGITGVIYTARDAAHKRFIECIQNDRPLPLDLRGQIVYYAGPTPTPPGKVFGSAGPTTSGRMDAYAPLLMEKTGLAGMIGKGNRSLAVIAAIKQCSCVYFAAIGGAGALLAAHIKKADIVCYEDLGAEAVYRLEVKEFPVVVAIDCLGNNRYVSGPAAYKRATS
jgi:fumarate hydratase subunit beta